MTIEEVNDAMTHNKTVSHTHLGITASYKISGVITRYNKFKGWHYSLELRDLKADCIVYAPLEDTEIKE